MTSTIRHATPSDLAAIQAISDKAYAVYVAAMGRKPGPMLADYTAHLAADVVLVAIDGDEVVRGYAVVLDQPDGFWLDNIAVDPAAQGQGIGGRLLAIFGGEDSYVSPNWYPGKAAHHKVVPTWNYRVVHLHGRITFGHDEKSKRAIVGRLTTRFEREMNGNAAWKMADAPADFMTEQLQAIVGMRIEIDRVEAKSKLSQNRAPEDFDAVTDRLDQLGRDDLARRMRGLGAARQTK